MDTARIRRAQEIFQDAVASEPAQRRELVAAEGAGDPELRAFVERMLQHDAAGMGAFLRAPCPGIGTDEVPHHVGDYEVVRKVGEGGMGVVYEARQPHPHRAVALKVLRLAFPDAETLRRFQFESEVLGRLQHPGIAQIYEAGTAEIATSDGAVLQRPFIAMEWVDGEPLIEYAQRQGLDGRARLALAALVCDAVQHAHQKGVIHRDLKPGNILVDAHGQPKLLDFGVARLTGGAAPAAGRWTQAGELLGTLPYMSPEQMAGDPDDIDTRLDVYALGVVLYELLAGRPPYHLDGKSLAEVSRVICEAPPTRLGLIRDELRGEIETIVGRALEKDRTRRYQTAAGLATDIRRHLRGEIIEARRDSALYVLRKTVARHRGRLVAAGLVVVLALALALVSFVQSERNRQLAEHLAAALTSGNLERGRVLGRTNDLLRAETLLWREYLRDPQSRRAYWALWELYAHNPILASLDEPDGLVRELAFAPDGRTFAAGTESGVLRLWNLATLVPERILWRHETAVRAVAYSPDGRSVAAGTADGHVRVLDALSGSALQTLPLHEPETGGLAFTPDGRQLVSSDGTGTLFLWDLDTAECRGVLAEHRGRVLRLCFSPDGRWLASAGTDSVVKLWRDLSGPCAATLTGHKYDIYALAFSADGRWLASGGNDKTIRVWDLQTNECAQRLEAVNGTIRFLQFQSDDTQLISGGWWRFDRWDRTAPDSGFKRAPRPVVSCGANVFRSGVTPDGSLVVTRDHGVRVIETTRSFGAVQLGGKTNTGSPAISPDGRVIACGDSSGCVRLWDLRSGNLLASWPTSPGGCSTTFDPTGRILATHDHRGVAQLWDLETRICQTTIMNLTRSTTQRLDFSPDGGAMALARLDNRVEIRGLSDGRQEVLLPATGSEPLAVRFSPDGATVAVARRYHGIELWTRDGQRHTTLATDVTPWNLQFRSDGTRLAAACWGGQIQVWDLIGNRLETKLESSQATCWAVAWRPGHPDLLVSASADGTVRLWDVSAKCELVSLEPFEGFDAHAVAFSPDGQTLVGTGTNGALYAWDLAHFDRHIAGNARFQIERLRADLGDQLQEEPVRAWCAEVLSRPWPLRPGALIDHLTLPLAGSTREKR